MANLSPEQHAGSWVRPIDVPSYISGYFDGEGCFTVSISPRPTLRVGWEVRPSVSVSQNSDRIEVLDLIMGYFGCGTLRPDRSDRTLKWEVRSLPLIRERVVPHFRKWPLISGKRKDFELFARICVLMWRGEYRKVDGLKMVVELVGQMNPSGKRIYSEAEIMQSLSR